MRLDQWLWTVRLYRTRTLATVAIRNGWVTVNGDVVKPAREVQLGQQIQARTGDITRTYRVLGTPESRVSAPQVAQFAEDLTPASELERRREPSVLAVAVRPRGSGRPTKRDRRTIDQLRDSEL